MMKNYLNHLLASLVAMLVSVSLSAHDVEIDGIYYNLNNETQEATVTYKGSSYSTYTGEYSRSVAIPASITSGDITYNVTSIGDYAFYGCKGLTSVTISESVTSIGNFAFRGCTGLTSVSIPDGVTSIGNFAFYECSGLTKPVYNKKYFVRLPTSYQGGYIISEGTEIICDYAFTDCSRLTSLTIPDGVTSIGSSAFQGCSGLTSITIPENVTSIASSAFYGCSGLTSITIPESVTSIGSYAFYGCSGLTSITIPEGMTSIGDNTFSGCSGLTSITIPEGVTSIGVWAFKECSGLTSITIPEGVTSIGGGAFYGCSGLTSITIPEGVTSIGVRAFEACSGLTSVSIPESVTSIGNSAFYKCRGLTSVSIPESVTSIGDYAFQGCTSLTEPVYNKKIFASFPISYQGDYTIPKGIETICGSAFYGCRGLTSITIPESVTSIGDMAFSGCTGTLILNCDIPNGMPDKYPLRGSKFTSVTVNGKSIGANAFYYCSTIETVKIGESVTSIGGLAFEGCRGLTKVEFASIEHLCSIKFGNNSSNPLSYVKHLFVGGEEVTEAVIPESVTSIGDYAFYGCSGLTTLTIPESVTSIGEYAFSGCIGIKTVNALSATPPTAAANSFYDVYNTAFLYVPLGCEEAYGTAEGWSSFAKLREKDFGTKDCLLTLKGFNGGNVALKCKTRSTYAFQIHAEEGWKVSSLTFNGADATANIAADGSYTTPSLTDDSELCVVFEEEGSAVGAISTEDVLRVSASGCVLSVQNEGEAVQATIFTTDGKQVKAIEAKRGTTQVRLAEGQVYLVKVDGRTFKVAM